MLIWSNFLVLCGKTFTLHGWTQMVVKQGEDKARKWCLKATTSGSFGSGSSCKYKESQAFWIRTLKGVSDDLYFNDLKLSSILAMAKLFYGIAPAGFDLCLCSYPFQLLWVIQSKLGAKQVKPCRRTWSKIMFLLCMSNRFIEALYM